MKSGRAEGTGSTRGRAKNIKVQRPKQQIKTQLPIKARGEASK